MSLSGVRMEEKGVRLAELTWPEAAEAIERYPIAVLPIGAGAKEHGPHLPCGTDQFLVEELARRVVEATPVLLLPTLAYAYYPAFVEWPGSVSISADIFAGVVADIVRSLARHGTRKFLILDSGVSTHPPLVTLSRDLYQELGVLVAVTNIRGLGVEVKRGLAEQPSGGHADEGETSCLLNIRPDLVKMERAVREFQQFIPGSRGEGGVIKIAVGGKLTTPHGVNGDATLATVEKGKVALDAMAQDVINFLEHFAGWPEVGEDG
jgi:creatinine amidohydrolase